MACVVVFCTVYALILPAITLEPEPVCGLEEHSHDESCYTYLPPVYEDRLSCLTASLIHQHSESCYDGNGQLICGQADYVIHYHDSSCYDTAGNLVCPLPVVTEHVHTEECYRSAEGHIHTEKCYAPQEELTCGLEESKGHLHNESCYDETGELVCSLEEDPGHVHTAECYTETPVLICGLEESEDSEPELICEQKEVIPHIHEAGCYDAAGNLICGRLETRFHQHSVDCMTQVEISPAQEVLTCGLPEHIHTEDCYPQQEPTPDPIEEPPADEEPEEEAPLTEAPVYCGKEAHTHTEDCYWYGQLACELEEHTHTEECYVPPVAPDADPNAGLETRADWEATMQDVQLTGEYRQDVLAIAESQLGYMACAENYIIDENGQEKRISRYGQWYGDPYGDWCAMFVSFCLHYAEVDGMPLNANCQKWIETLSQPEYDLFREAGAYAQADLEDLDEVHSAYDPQPGDLVFFDYNLDGTADHVALVTGLTEATEAEAARLKTIERAPGDQVAARTYSLPYAAIAGFASMPEQTFYCGQSGHAHAEACYAGGLLVCGMEEHIHTEECEEPGIPSGEAATLEYTGDGYVISVTYGPEAALPEGVMLTAREILSGTEEYEAYYAQSQSALAEANPNGAGTLTFARFFDVQFLLDGKVVEPAAPVSVTITYTETLETGSANGTWAVHFAEDGTEILDADADVPEEGGTSFTHTQDGFSVVGDLMTVSYSASNPTDVGPDYLPVDYYVCIDGEWTCVGSSKTGWYFSDASADLTDYNRDYITVAQAAYFFGTYGFPGEGENPSRVMAYQQISGHLNIYSDTTTVEKDGNRILPLSRNTDHAGYRLYYLPNNSSQIDGVASPDGLDKTANGFYTIKVFDAQSKLLTSDVVLTGGSFKYTVEGYSDDWLIAYGSGSTATISGSSIEINNITSSVIVSPTTGGNTDSHSVTFKVLVDGAWKTVGSLPYYYSGNVNNPQRAYITSAMAAQFFGDYGYTATAEPGYQFGYSYNDIYTLFYANGTTQTNFCMDVTGGTLAEGQTVQLYESNNSDAQIFRIWDAGSGYSFITPIGSSSYHVNVYGYTTGDPSSTQLKLSTATNKNSQWKVDTGSDGRTTFWSAIAPDDQVIDLNNAQMSNGGRLQIWHSTGGARYWYMVQRFRISNSIVSEQNSDGTYNIGLTAESNGDIVCYYLPGVTTPLGENLSEEAVAGYVTDGTWSVTVRDDTHSVYTEGELSQMTQQVSNGGTATVTVKNADGILWSCTGASDYEASQSEGYTTFVIRNVTQPVEIVATKANPSFTVQFYANIPRFATSGSNPLKVIDTSGKALPTNGGSMATRNLYLEGTGRSTDQNAGVATELYQIATQMELTKLYSDENYQYSEHPGLEYFNKLKDNESYTLKEIWVLKAGKDAASTNRDDWDIYTYSSEISFTNEASKAAGNTILITDGAVIRLVSDTSTGEYYNGTTFYDYNISSGQNSDGRWRTGITGINIESNYGTSLNGQRTWRSGADVFAFGNANCGTGMSGYLFDGSTLNKYSSKNSGYGGATFGLASGLNSDGTIRYNEWIVAPKLFNDGDANGKQTYAGSSLTFDRVGDTYTLSAATLKNSNGQSNTLSGLQYFFNPSPTSGTTHTHIFTNNFWPMDAAAGRTDALWGAYGNPGSFQGFVESNSYNWSALPANFPVSDDGRAHNWFFGMNFAISFNLTADYEGPLEYYFFGDDDLWVFLDGTLVCDIGGVHSSIGEYVNLRDYLPVGSSGQHTLSFFYTERGASGSTCYMSFTLPSVSSATTAQDTGSLQIEKQLKGTGGADFSGVEYQFQVELLTNEKGSALNQTFSYSRSDGTYGTIRSGGTIPLHQNDTVTISGIPAGTFYRVTELTHDGYLTTVNGNEGFIVSGKIETGLVEPASFVNTVYHELPNSGGPGTYWYTVSGIAVLLLAAGLMYKKLRRRKEAHTS